WPTRRRPSPRSSRRAERGTPAPLGARPKSRDRLLPHGDLTDKVVIQVVAEAGLVANPNRASRGCLNRGRDNIARPVALAGGHVSGQRKVGQSRQSDVVRAAYTRFQHAAAPDREARGLRGVVDPFGLSESADASQFDVDDAAGAHADGLLGVVS